MASLTQQEILAQLKQLGISSTSDINTYFQEYMEYSILHSTHSHSAQVHYEGAENS